MSKSDKNVFASTSPSTHTCGGLSIMLNASTSAFGGLRVIQDVNAVRDTGEPVRKLAVRRWMRGRAYHRRIQKKWVKRFGTKKEPCAFRAGSTLIVHPAMYAGLQREGLT